MTTWNGLVSFLLAVGLLGGAPIGCAGAPRTPQVLPAVGASFAAPYEAVWEATLKSLGVIPLRRADRVTGRIETEAFPFTYTVGAAPTAPPLRLATAVPGPWLAQDSGAIPTQVIWIAMSITVIRAGEARTDVQVVPSIHDALLSGFTPGPTNNAWVDLFARIRSHLGIR